MEPVDIWSTGAFAFESPLKDLLDSLDYNLDDLLAEDELLQELRGLHPQLVSFFSSEANVAGLVRCLINPPPPSYEAYCVKNQHNNHQQHGSWNAHVEADANENAEMEEDFKDALDVPETISEHDDEMEDVDISVHDLKVERAAELLEHKDENADAEKNAILPGQWLMDNITEAANANTNGKNRFQECKEAITQEEYEARNIRYPYMACEVICCEVTQILDILVEGSVPISMDHEHNKDVENDSDSNPKSSKHEQESILDLLFSMLFTTPASQLDDRRAGYLEKILTVLFRTKRAAMTSYINGDHIHKRERTQHEKSEEYVNSIECKTNMHHRGGGAQLLHGLFKHLHSNSISQIVQRLLMPQPPSLSFANIENSHDGPKDNEGDGAGGGNNNASNDSDSRGYNYGHEENDEEDDCLSNEMEDFGGINCNWADDELGITLLLDHLMIDHFVNENGTEAVDTTTPTTYTRITNNAETDDEYELRLSISQHACEILTSIIQHSPLSSNVIKTMTGEQTLTRLIQCIRGKEDDNKVRETCPSPQSFSMHESAMTTAMHVLETLVLQLGGYGTVPTANMQGECDDDDDANTSSNENANRSDTTKSEFRQNRDNLPSSEPVKETEAMALMRLLPELLDSLASLLKHPDTTKWQSQFQYSKRPQKLLGSSRLRIVRLLESLVLLSIRNIDLVLCSSDCLQICLDLFWDFPWCSMLHQSVANLLVHVLEGGEQRIDLQLYFLTRCNLPKRLIDSFEVASYSTTADNVNDGDDGSGNESNEDTTHQSMIGKKNGEKMTYSAVLAMKNLDQISGSSSVDASLGSDSSGGNEADEIPVSDDDVEAAIEQLKIYHEENEEKKTQQLFDDEVYKRSGDTGHSNATYTSDELKNSDVNVKAQSNVVKKDIVFRLGYMGHVIIICQALVHASGSVDQAQNISIVEDKKESTNETKTDESLNDSPESDSVTVDQIDPEEASSPRPIQRNIILSLLKGNRYYSQWQSFVKTTLASETAVQSTPLGGYNTQDESNAEEHQREDSKWDTADQYVEENHRTSDNTGNTNYVVSSGEIDLDDTDLDIAASMMESMNLPSSEESLNSVGDHSRHRRHQRQRGVIGGHQGQGMMKGKESSGNGSSFGTVVQMHQKQETSGGYIYDDPLGARHHFMEEDEDEEAKSLETDNTDGENEVPVLDLFAGNFDFDDDAADADGDNDDTGWANFDDAFGDTPDAFPMSLDDENKSSTQAYNSQGDPFDLPNDLFGMIANSANIISNFGLSDEREKDKRDIKKGDPIIEVTEEDDQ